VGTKKPNDLGFFDMLGNVWCRCQDYSQDWPADIGDNVQEDESDRHNLDVPGTVHRITRGGSFRSDAWEIRAARRVGVPPLELGIEYGFRVARTIR
jgi:formylglycine-generating enzyme required for sulfatase activity